MADDNATELVKRGDKRFAKRQSLDAFRQEIALNFAPWHATWQSELTWGEDFAAHLIDGTPLLLARDFVGQIGAMLRPAGKQYFWHRTAHDKLNNNRKVRQYLDWRSTQMMRIMTDRVTGFQRATKQADEFFGLFGDAVISVDTSTEQDSLRYRAWHTKDCVWSIGSENKPDQLTRKEMVAGRVILQRYKGKKGCKLHPKMLEAIEKDPDQEFEIRHEVMPGSEYDSYARKGDLQRKEGWASIWVDVANKHIIKEANTSTFRYCIPRWVTLPGNPYALSPASVIAMPDARLIQQQAGAILEAAEKQINPPLIATQDTIRGDVSLISGGITWIDKGYDERTGDPLRPLDLGKNFNLGVDSLLRTEQQLAKAFFLDVLRMPDTRSTRSVQEIQFKIDEYVRASLPLFAPMHSEYSESLFYETDMQIAQMGGYTMPMPDELKDQELQYQWDNPLSDMLERQKSQVIAEISQLGQTVAALEMAAQQAPSIKHIDHGRMFREGAMGLGAATWLLDEDEAEEEQNAMKEAAAQQQMMAQAPNIAQVIDSGVNAASVAAEIAPIAEPGYPMLSAPQ